MAKVEFLFDFGSPNAYLAHLVIPEIEQRTKVKFDYVPILLGGVFKLTNNSSPAEKLAGIKNRLQYEHLELQRFIRRHGISKFKWNPFFPVNTLLIMRGAIAAGLDGDLARYVDEMFKHMWGEPKDMDDPAVVAAALKEVRLRCRTVARAYTEAGRQGQAFEEYARSGRARQLRQSDVLCRQ